MSRSGTAQQALLATIADPEATVVDAARAYRAMIGTRGQFDWKDINEAIIDRWSMTGLIRIKNLAWDAAQHGIDI